MRRYVVPTSILGFTWRNVATLVSIGTMWLGMGCVVWAWWSLYVVR
jgi:hypothetical protein